MTTENRKLKLVATLLAQYPAGIPRSAVGKATGGLVSPKLLANLAITNKGPVESFLVRNRRVYPVEIFVEWLFENEA